MKNKINILIQDTYYWLSELEINDIFKLNAILGGFDDIEIADYLLNSFLDGDKENSLLASITNCPFDILYTLSFSDFRKFVNQFIELNKLFFAKSKKKDTPVQGQKSNPNDHLFELCCHLIEYGHPNVMGYGYSYLLKAINNHEKIKAGNIAGVAIAIRMANHADDKAWKKYMRSLGVK